MVKYSLPWGSVQCEEKKKKKKKTWNIYLVGINLFDLSVNKVINQFMAFLGFYAYEIRCIKETVSQM